MSKKANLNQKVNPKPAQTNSVQAKTVQLNQFSNQQSQNVQPESILFNLQNHQFESQIAQISNNIAPVNSNTNNLLNQIPAQQYFVQPQINLMSTNIYPMIPHGLNQISSGSYQNPQIQQSNFTDDDEIFPKEKVSEQKNKSINYNLHDILTLKAKSGKSRVKLDPMNDKKIPILVSFSAENSDFNLNERSNVDLVCVIDQSGSMGGEKIKLVKDSFKFLLELLGDNDRLSVVAFQNNALRISKLTRTSAQNKKTLQEMINRINPSGGTNINSGVTMALEILKQRRFKNDQATIFVLSDGVDNVGKQAKALIQNTLNSYEQYESLIGNYTLNTFGYGKDTDSEVMSAIAESKDGTFFFIEKLDMVDECFVDCLGSILTSVGENVILSVSSLNSEILPGISISKGLGGKNIWTWNNDKTEYITKISKLILGKTKDFILELNIPKSGVKLDNIVEIPVVNINLSADNFNSGDSQKTVKKSLDLNMEFFSDNIDTTEQEIEDPELAYNFFRLTLAETMDQAKGFADKQKYDQAKQVLISLQNEITNSKYYNTSEKIKLIIEEIKIALKDVSPQEYTNSGSHNLISNMNCNYKQKSKPMNVQYNLFSNSYQMNMNNNIKMSKKK
jgi:uncharacterized protein YegL